MNSMTAHASIARPDSVLAEADRLIERHTERASLRQRIEQLLREIFEGHEDFLGVTPD